MPNSASAKKRLRQNEDSRLHNKARRSAVKTQIKKVRQAVADGDMARAEEEFRNCAKRLDKASSVKLIHPNKAARTKSRLSHLIKKSKAAS